MTEENYQYRISPFLLRNQFPGPGRFQIPVVPRCETTEEDFSNLRLIGFDRTNLENNNHLDRMVHFFLYDYKFERVWKNPDTDLERLRRYRAVFTPDFSMYLEMAPVVKLYNTFRNRWCGAYWASKGIRVIPTVSWGGEDTFDFCFEGIQKGSTVAVSTYMVSAHGDQRDQKEFFLRGYNELLRRVEPERVVCYNQPFPEMRGNIVFVDYDLSSWKYMDDDPYVPSKFVRYIHGELPLPENSGIVIKQGFVVRDAEYQKGMGSAFGGGWKPKDKDSERFLGIPGEIKYTTKENGEVFATKIGPEGRAIWERHFTNHDMPKFHSEVHDHLITWDNPKGSPKFGREINYWPGEYPDGAPEMKYYKKRGVTTMSNKPLTGFEQYRFQTICDFKDCVNRGGEIEIVWNEKRYHINYIQGSIAVYEAYKEESIKFCKDADDALEYLIGGIRLRDIITKVGVLNRTF